VTIPISLQGGTIPAQLAVANGSLYVLEPPFQANGYEGFATLTKVTPS
jgi:hypothetical protein